MADALRPGQELMYYQGETNFRAADILVINKSRGASKEAIEIIESNAARGNFKADVVITALKVIA